MGVKLGDRNGKKGIEEREEAREEEKNKWGGKEPGIKRITKDPEWEKKIREVKRSKGRRGKTRNRE